MATVKTRFAPSPTGWLHVGGIRTALFAWIIAKQQNGQFILRIEDTDKSREVTHADKHIMDSLKWLGLNWDEGPIYQSKRLSVYKKWGQKLIDAGRAYADPYDKETIDGFRAQAKTDKKPFLFRNFRPDDPPKWDGSQPLRFKSDPRVHHWEDAVMGKMSSSPEAVDDFILIKADGYPTYNFAHIIDDYELGITHVIRSQEFIASVPRFLNLYEALNIKPPIMVTLPVVLGAEGHKKLSKRDGAKDIMDYSREGFLPDAMFNFLVTLGWNDGTTQEIFSRVEVIEKFEVKRIQKSGAKFDEQRLVWMNGYYIRQLSLPQLLAIAQEFWPAEALNYDDEYKMRVLALVQERLKFLGELGELTKMFFVDLPVNLDLIKSNKSLSSIDSSQLKKWLSAAVQRLEKSDFSLVDLTKQLNELLPETKQTPAVLFSLIRTVTTWTKSSPALAESLAVLGKKTTLDRLRKAIDKI